MYGTALYYPVQVGTIQAMGTMGVQYWPVPDMYRQEEKIYSLLHYLLVKQRVFRKRIGGF